MKLQIMLGKLPWNVITEKDPSFVKEMRSVLNKMFAAYMPKRLSEDPSSDDYLKHEMQVPADDPNVEKILKDFDQQIRQVGRPIGAILDSFPTTDEVKRARFLELMLFGDSVDTDSNGRPLNPPQRILCESCKFPDITSVPNPLLVSKAVLKNQDVFRVSTGMLLVRPHVLKLLKDIIGGQIETGDAVVAKSKGKATGDDRLFWVRPKEMLGDELSKKFPKRCPVCQRPLESRVNLNGKPDPGLIDSRPRLEHFGSGKADLAVLGGYYGEIHEDGRPSWHWQMAISGRLASCLKSNGVKGFAVMTNSDPAKCFHSSRGDSILDANVREFDIAAKPKSVAQDPAKIEGCRKTVASLKRIPWDCDKDGYVYFYLMTPELIILDPMTWEEDSEGPYSVKKFKKPGLYRLHVKAIRAADEEKRGVAVDSGILLLIDNAFFAELQEVYDWDNATKSNGNYDWNYHSEIAAKIGNRFGICSPPPKKFKSQFEGDGFYSIDVKGIEPA